MFSLHSPFYPFGSRRTCVYAQKGMVATSQPLAAAAGLRILQKGGNAVDAAVATAAALTVVEPTSNGIGGDAFCLLWHKGKLWGLNSSGRSPKALTAAALAAGGHKTMPTYGWAPVTVAGAPAAWAALNERFGRLSLLECLEPAIIYGEEGYPLSPTLAYYWQKAAEKFKSLAAGAPEVYRHWFETFAPKESAPQLGEVCRLKDHAATLKRIGETNAQAFYEGDLAARMDAFSSQSGGWLRKEDLAAHTVSWDEPLSVSYRGFDVWELPPNGQGLIALAALGLMEGFEVPPQKSSLCLHRQIEALKLAFADGQAFITDPAHMTVAPQDLLRKDYLAARRRLIGPSALLPASGRPQAGGTVYLAAADGEGTMVSFIQSNYMGFGSGLVVPATGIALQNRGCSFSLDPQAANFLQPSKRPYHTIIPGFLTQEGRPLGPFGVMGGFMQPQGHMQAIMNLVDFGLNPQAALDAPRWLWQKDKKILVERSLEAHMVEDLLRRGHEVEVAADGGPFGRGEIILRDSQTGVLVGATEGRADGCVAAY